MDAAVLAGSDIPGLDAGLFQLAFEMLVHADMVLGPAEDGGYYLIGMRAPGADVFKGIPWSTGDVLNATRETGPGARVGDCVSAHAERSGYD